MDETTDKEPSANPLWGRLMAALVFFSGSGASALIAALLIYGGNEDENASLQLGLFLMTLGSGLCATVALSSLCLDWDKTSRRMGIAWIVLTLLTLAAFISLPGYPSEGNPSS